MNEHTRKHEATLAAEIARVEGVSAATAAEIAQIISRELDPLLAIQREMESDRRLVEDEITALKQHGAELAAIQRHNEEEITALEQRLDRLAARVDPLKLSERQ